MSYEIKKAAVLGAGVMGATIAAHLTNAGFECVLLDIIPPQLTEDDKKKGLTEKSPAWRNRFAANGLAGDGAQVVRSGRNGDPCGDAGSIGGVPLTRGFHSVGRGDPQIDGAKAPGAAVIGVHKVGADLHDRGDQVSAGQDTPSPRSLAIGAEPTAIQKGRHGYTQAPDRLPARGGPHYPHESHPIGPARAVAPPRAG